MTYTASVFHRPEKPFGVGRTVHQCGQRIVGGWRAEVIDGLPDGEFAYTGVCTSREGAISELTESLKARGLHGKLRIV